MKKNFFKKKLASGLALALVVASLSPAGVSAATATKIVKQGGAAAPTVLYVGNKGTDYSLSKTYKTNTYSWKISNSKVATINAKTGVVTPKAPGTVTIRVTARNAKTNKWLKDFTLKLSVKQRATSVDIGSDDFDLAVGTKKDLNAVKTPKTSTDVVVYGTSDAKIATVDAKTGIVTAVAPGTATITVYSKGLSSSANTSKYNRTDAVKVTVLDGIQGVKQTTPSKVEISLATDQSKTLTKDNLVITDANGMKQIIKEVKFSADGKTATAEVYIPFVDKAVYKVAYADTAKDFTASVGEVAKIVLEGKTVQYQKETGLSVKLYDANGVDVTTNDLLANRVTFDYDLTKAFVGAFDDGAFKINVFDYPVAVTVKAIYHTFDYTSGEEKVYDSTAVVNSVEKIANTASDIQYTLASESADWNKVNSTIPAGASQYKLFVKAKDQTNKDINEGTDGFKFESSDTSILVVSQASDGVYVYPVKAGTAYIKATYGATIKMLAVTVGAEAKAVSLTVDKSNAVLSKNAGSFVDTAKFTVTVKDQYGNSLTDEGKNVGVEVLGTDATKAKAADFVPNGKSVEFTVGSATEAGTYTYKLTYLDKSQTISVRVVDVANKTDVSTIRIERSTDTVDVVMNDKVDSSKKVTFEVYGYNAAGQKVAKLTNVDYKLTLSGKEVKDEFNTTTGEFKALSVSGSSVVVTAAAVGTYIVTAEASYRNSGDTTDTTKKITTSFTVTNSQVKPTISQKATTTESTDLEDIIKDSFSASKGSIIDAEVVVNGKTISFSDLKGITLQAGNVISVKSITVQETFDEGLLNTKVAFSGAVTIK